MKYAGRFGTGLLALLPAVVTAGSPREALDFAKLATDFAAEQGLDPETAGNVLFKDVLAGPGFVGMELGFFDVRFPTAALADGDRAKDFKVAVQTLLDLQAVWLDWYESERDGYAEATADIALLRKWIGGWSLSSLKKAARGTGDLLDRIRGGDKVRESAARLRAFAGPTEEQRFELGEDVGRIVFAPTRRAFLEILAFLGWIDPERRPSYWKQDNVGITASWYDWTAIVPLEAAGSPSDPEDPFAGVSHDERDKTGLRQFVADRGGASLLRATFYRTDFSVFETAVREDLVVATVGRNDLYLSEWGLSYARSGASTQGSTRWVPATGVPGKAAAGGGAPLASITITAKHVPRWRKDAGEDFFVRALRRGQEDGAILAGKKKQGRWKDRRIHFALDATESNDKVVVSAPFLGPDAQRKPPVPEPYRSDFVEFFRAYRAAFFHWLREFGAGDPDGSHEAFRRLMREHADAFGDAVFEDRVQRIYGMPLSDQAASENTLEGRFLAWLSRQRS